MGYESKRILKMSKHFNTNSAAEMITKTLSCMRIVLISEANKELINEFDLLVNCNIELILYYFMLNIQYTKFDDLDRRRYWSN